MSRRKNLVYVGDFETTVYEGQTDTEVWASALVPLYSEDVVIHNSIAECYKYLEGLKKNVIVYYHNLAFDGSFWLSWLLTEKEMQQAYTVGKDKEGMREYHFFSDRLMGKNTIKYQISDMGQWYRITIKTRYGKFIELRDSFKLIPTSVKKMGDDFQTKHKKLSMNYEGFRFAGCEITEEERKYIANDVLVVKEALEIMFNQGHDRLTIASNCLHDYKEIVKTWGASVPGVSPSHVYDTYFPNLYAMHIDKEEHGAATAGDWIRRAYRGGWCYVVPGKSKRVVHGGCTADVNSLYPFVMHSDSGFEYPIGYPHFWRGNFIPETATGEHRFFYIRIKTRFYLKPGKLPFIQIKRSKLYKSTKMLETSDYEDRKTGKFYRTLSDGYEMIPTLTLTQTDYYLIKEHYTLEDTEILDGCWFEAMPGLFDEYIDKWKDIKENSTGSVRSIAKLFMNSLYGKFSASIDSSFKVAFVREDGVICFRPQHAEDQPPGYIPIGAAITSYARYWTITAAQKNYHGENKPGFIYADTDSIHCDMPPEELKGIEAHPTRLGCWKIETEWDEAYFTRQKTYIEHVIVKDGRPLSEDAEKEKDRPYYNVTCAGMPDRQKRLFQLSLTGTPDARGFYNKETDDFTPWLPDEWVFLFDENGKPIKREYENFDIGLCVPGKLTAKRIKGGILLVRTTYEMR